MSAIKRLRLAHPYRIKTMQKAPNASEIMRNIAVALAVSFVAISLGASLGILSGRGAFAGMISSAVIAFITSFIGGTRIQCSGPTAPMSAVSAVVVAFSVSQYHAGLTSDQFVTLVFLMMAVIVILLGVLRVGRFITVIPQVVISGFMNGIALLIWVSQINLLFGLNGAQALDGPLTANLFLIMATITCVCFVPLLIQKTIPRYASFLPGTLVGVIVVSSAAALLQLPVQFTDLEGSIYSFSDLQELVVSQISYEITLHDLKMALPFALQLALLCYLDTLLTSVVVDKMTQEKTQQNKELIAQGVASGAAAIVGGIPGAQATIRSVLMVKEKASLRLAGMLAGIFVLIEILLFQDMLGYIPSAVFSGILIKVGYDVFDWDPIIIYFRQLKHRTFPPSVTFITPHGSISHLEMLFVLGTMVVTLFCDLNTAVIAYTALFHILTKIHKDQPGALDPPQETQAFHDEL